MPTLERLTAEHLRAVVVAYRDGLRAHQDRLNRLNVYPVPDGDTGTNMALTLESVVAEMDTGGSDLASVCRAIAHGSLMGARGNSGVILSQILRGMTDSLKGADQVGGPALAAAMAAAATAAYGAVMRPVEGTILTVVREAAEAGQAVAGDGAGLAGVLQAAGAAADAALARTPELLPVLAEAGVVDAGGAGFVLFIDAARHVVEGRPLPEAGEVASTPTPVAVGPGAHGEAATDLRYEVMFLLEAPDGGIEGFKQAWASLGDSIVVVGGDGLWNCHVHTDDAGAAVEAGVDAGRPRRIRITDLRDQVEEERWVREGSGLGGPATATAPSAVTGVVAVAAGTGVSGIFRSLGVGRLVEGGQTMNPSTAQLLAAVEAVAAEGVVILPNNRNVVAVARQAAALSSKPVQVVVTHTVPEGFAALMGFDAGAGVEANAKSMADAALLTSAGEVTRAVRAGPTPAGRAGEGDWLGLVGDEIVLVRATLPEAACALLERMVGDAHELVTIVAGEGADEATTADMAGWLERNRPGVAVEVHDGGQPLSPYLFGVE